jgi:hypothetical protein
LVSSRKPVRVMACVEPRPKDSNLLTKDLETAYKGA